MLISAVWYLKKSPCAPGLADFPRLLIALQRLVELARVASLPGLWAFLVRVGFRV